MAKFKKVGQGTYGVYEKQKTDWGAILGGIVLFVILVAIFA